MTIKKQIDHSIEDLASQLNVDVTELLHFLNNKNTSIVKVPEYKVTDLILDYLESLEKSKKAKNTKKRHRYFLTRFNKFIEITYPNVTVNKLNEAIVFEFLDLQRGRKEDSLSKGSQNNYIGIIKALLTYAYLYNITEKNYSNKLSLLQEDLLPRYFSSQEINLIISESLTRIHGYRYHAIISVLLGTGCRISELVNFRVCDINFENQYLFIRKSKNYKERYIPLYPEIQSIILDYLRYTGVTSPDFHQTNGYLFSKDFGEAREKPISIRAIQDICSKIFRKLNLSPELTIHSFRHTFAVRSLQVGMKIHDLSMILGHSNINTTYRYVQLFPTDLKNEILNNYPFPLDKLVNKVLSWEDSNE